MEKELNISIDEPIFSISTAAKLLGISIPTLRIYEKEGLIIPFREKSNQRLYSQNDIKRIKCIRATINEKKISINGIKSLYALIPCWDIVKCSEEERQNCPAYTESAQPCWTYDHSGRICKSRNCYDCEVYKGLIDCKDVKEFLKKIKEQRQAV